MDDEIKAISDSARADHANRLLTDPLEVSAL